MQSRSLHLLEYPKVLAVLAGMAQSVAGRQACLDLLPATDADTQAERAGLLLEYLHFRGSHELAWSAFEDLDGLFRLAEAPASTLDLDDLFALREALGLARGARDTLAAAGESGRAGQGWPRLTALTTDMSWPELTWSGLRRCLGPDGRLRDESSPELWEARQEIRRINQLCTRKVKDFLQKENLGAYLQDDYLTVSSDRYVVPLRTNFKGRVQGIIHDYSQTGETCYFEPLFLVELNNELQEHRQAERVAERAVLTMLTGLLRQELGAARGVFDFLVRLDVLEACRKLAAATEGRPLVMTPAPEGEAAALSLLSARHPLLVLGGAPVQAMDIRLGDGQYALIVSGGNAGGKTVCLKTLGLCVVMAQAGLPVPVDEGSSLPLWRQVFAFLGDEQSLEEHLSTFTAQIHSLSQVWEQVGPGSLVILDEFGAGTDPAQGAALAQAVIEAIMDRESRVVAATHFPSLKVYGLSEPRARSASVLFDPRTKRPLYRLAYDQVGASQALDVAREHGLPAEIIARAEKNLLLSGGDTTAQLDRLNALAVDKDRELAALRQERLRLKDKEAKLAERYEREKKALLAEVAEASRQVVRDWQEQKIGRKKAQQDLSDLRRRIAGPEAEDAAPEAPAFSFDDLAAGQRVRYLPWNKAGSILEKDARRRQVKLDLDGVALWVEFDKLEPLAGGSAPAARRKAAAPVAAGGGPILYLDLRGQRGDAAVGELSRFLDQALLKGAQTVEIIHGRGTGALRREVHEFLRSFPAVKSHRLAPEDEGGDGKTVVELK